MKRQVVLIVEDNPITRKMVRIALETDGYAVLEAGSGAEALEKLERGPDIVLQDLGLPDMDGFDLAARIRAHPCGRDIPLVAFTGLLNAADKVRAGAAGFTDILVKPLEPSRLLASLATWRGRLGVTSQSPGHGQRLLVVDDDAIQLKLAKLRLEDAGFAVETAPSGTAALDMACQSPPAAILTDILMPGMDGFHLTRLVRREPRLRGVPIVLMTSHFVDPSDGDLARRMGASGFALRSPSFDAIVQALTSALASPLPAPPADDDDPALDQDYRDRIAHQLERQVTLNAGLWERLVVLSSSFSVLSGISRALANHQDTEAALAEALGACLDAAGLAKGTLHLLEENGRLRLVAQVGLVETAEAADLFPPDVKAHLASSDAALALPLSPISDAEARAFLERLGSSSALVVPIQARGERLGVLTLGSHSRSLAEGDWLPFASAVATQMGLAISLTRAFRMRASAIESLGLRERAIEALGDGLVITDSRQEDDPVIYLNPAFEKMTGYSAQETIGRNCRFLQTPETDPEARRLLREAVAEGRPARAEVLNRRKDGRDYWCALEMTPIRDSRGALNYYVGLMRDVTERRGLEEQLRQAQKMEAVGQLAGGVAHDFNNLLGVITGYAQLLKNQLTPKHPGHKRIEMILRAAERAAGLTRQLLAFGRKQLLQPKVIALDRVVGDVEPMLRRLLGETVQVVSLHHGGSLHVRADPGQIEQVVMNLAVNARDAMPKGGRVLIETRLAPSPAAGAEPAGDWVELSVRDEGEGMTPEVKSRIYEPFFTTKEPGRGTGLGLATVYGIVQQSGGHISVESVLGQGTRFAILLPRATPEATEATPRPRRTKRRRGQSSVLLVEDDDALRDLTREVLERAGYRVRAARRPSEALELAASEADPVDLLLLDVVLPEMSGPDLAARLARRHPGARVLYVSGYTTESVARHLKPDTPYLRKPFRPEELLDRIDEVLGGR